MPAAIVVIWQNLGDHAFPRYLNAARVVPEGAGENVVASTVQASDTVYRIEAIPCRISDRSNENEQKEFFHPVRSCLHTLCMASKRRALVRNGVSRHPRLAIHVHPRMK